jgi:putative transposase
MLFSKRKTLHLKDFDYKGGSFVYFVTICTDGAERYFSNPSISRTLAADLEFRAKDQIILYCYCIMPDHLHLLFSFHEKYTGTLQNWVSAFKRFGIKEVNKKFGIRIKWQRNFYEHVVRSDESLESIGNYILNNPVRKGMADSWEDYEFSKLLIDSYEL